jgi:hypothetical protein
MSPDGTVYEITARDLEDVEFAPANKSFASPADLEALVQKHFRPIPVAPEEIA